MESEISSHIHHSYSRIDFLLLDVCFKSEVHSCGHYSIVISDHVPVSIEISFPSGVDPPSRQGRLNSSFLAQASFKESLHSLISLFFDAKMVLQRPLDTLFGKLRMC